MPQTMLQGPGGQQVAVDGPTVPTEGEQQMILRAVTPTQDVYASLVETVIPRMNKALTHQELKALFKDVGIDEQAKHVGLTKWVDDQGKLISRKLLVQRLWEEPEFQALWRQQSQGGLNA